MDVTLLEIHLPGAAFNAPFASGHRGDADADPPTGEPGSTGSTKAAVVAFTVLVALALLAHYLRSRDRDPDDDTAA